MLKYLYRRFFAPRSKGFYYDVLNLIADRVDSGHATHSDIQKDLSQLLDQITRYAEEERQNP